MYKPVVLALIILFVLNSCQTTEKEKEKEWSDLPGIIRLDSLTQTDFAATLENPVDETKNIIYAPTLLYAWDTIQTILNGVISISDSNSAELKLLTQSSSYKNALTHDEYNVEALVSGNEIIAKAFFNKTLPFTTALHKADTMMVFDKAKVKAFGMYYFDEDAVTISDILYYANDDNFILKLKPKDSLQEILLVKGLDKMTSLAEAVNKTNELVKVGITEKASSVSAGNYIFQKEDIFSIPEIRFNIETNYKKLEGQVFYVGNDDKIIKTAYQRTGFLLNETGAVVESEAVMAVIDSATSIAPVAKPKRMIFDKPFYIIIKRVNAQNPYFVMRVANAELLRKE